MRFVDRAKGQWEFILHSAGLTEKQLNGEHQACPVCGGRDRWRYDGHKTGRGTSICGQCGARDGIQLLMAYRDMTFAQAAQWVEEKLGLENNGRLKRPQDNQAKFNWAFINDIIKGSTTITRGSPVAKHLVSRGISSLNRIASANLRYHPHLKLGDHHYPAMVAIVRSPAGKVATIHRTFFTPDGLVRKIAPGHIPAGSAIRLGPVGPVMGISEGIETALSFQSMHDVPTWAAISATMLEKWEAPEDCERVMIAGDNDKNYQGQAASYKLACKLSNKGLDVEVRIPEQVGQDWNDLHHTR